jgi:anti-sigma regulatory factor (Ser/Thr protein kinase)
VSQTTHPFRHEALLHAGDEEFVAGALPFIRGALDASEPILVAVGAARIRRLRDALGADARAVQFADMATLGVNPARIIPAWQAFVEEHQEDGGRIWGIGEPIWPGRSEAELSECYRHECLLNVAFAGTDGFTLLCPYDTGTLDPGVVERARDSHPLVIEHGTVGCSDSYSAESAAAPFADALPEPELAPYRLCFEHEDLKRVRGYVRSFAVESGLPGGRADDLVLAVHELASNSVLHGGGRGALRVWREGCSLICEVSDAGHITGTLVGRSRPAREGQVGGYGVWLANQLCELVQVRSFASGSVVRVHMHAV